MYQPGLVPVFIIKIINHEDEKTNMNFDEIINRNEVTTLKFDPTTIQQIFGTTELWPSWVADMDFKAAPEIITALTERLQHGIFGYESNQNELRDAVVNWNQKRYDWAFSTDEITFTPRTLNSLTVLIELFSNAGEGVIIQSPVFYDFKLIIRTTGRKLIKNALDLSKGRYFIDFEDLENKASDPSTTLLILCNPHNPVGRCWSRQELEKISDICIRHQVFIISDEIHGDLTYNNKYIPLASISSQAAINSASCISPVKSFNLAGLASSMVIINDEAKRKQFQNWYSRMEINKNFILSNVAMLAAYEQGENWLNQLIQYLQGNLEALKSILQQKIPAIKLIEPDGTFLVWLDCRELGLDIRQLETFLVKDAKMATNPGQWFGREGAGFVRINIACPRSVLITALNQLEKATDNFYKQC